MKPFPLGSPKYEPKLLAVLTDAYKSRSLHTQAWSCKPCDWPPLWVAL